MEPVSSQINHKDTLCLQEMNRGSNILLFENFTLSTRTVIIVNIQWLNVLALP